MKTLYGLTVDGDDEEALVYVWSDRQKRRATVLEDAELRELRPEFTALYDKLAMIINNRPRRCRASID